MRGSARQERDLTGAFDADGACLPASTGQCSGRSHRANLDIRRKTNAHVLALLAKLSLLSAQSFVVSELQCSIESPFVVCTVVDHPARGLEWEFARLRKVFPTNLSGIDFQFLC